MAELNSAISNEDPFLQRILPILAEIPQGVSPAAFKSIPYIKNPDEIHQYQQDSIITSSQNYVQKIWKENQISEKISKLKQLEATSPKEEAWRPTTGKTDVNSLMAEILTNTKQELQNYLEKLEQETITLKSYVKKFHTETENQIVEIHNAEEILLSVYNDTK